ncbi:MAG: DUF2059 domain-containing protein [Candidatus Sulfotelmatobacter sp.]|jgi:hypothetical protein
MRLLEPPESLAVELNIRGFVGCRGDDNEELLMTLKLWLCTGLLIASLCAGQTTVSIAPDAASKEDVKKLFDVMASREQTEQMMKQVFAQMRSLTREQTKQRRPDISDAELARIDRQSEDLLKHFPLDDMMNDMIPVYQKHFTKSDIDSLIAFYSSPAGQKFLHEMPAVTAETMKAVYPKIQAQVEAAMKRSERDETPQKDPAAKD